MTWSWLWDGTSAPASITDVPDWYVALIERKFKSCPPSLPASSRHAALRIAGDASTKAPRLAPVISPVTRRALAVLEPDLLHELLIIDDLEQTSERPALHTKAARTGESHRARMRRVAEALRTLAADLHVDGVRCTGTATVSGFTVRSERDAELHACWLLEQWAKEADERATSLLAPADAPEGATLDDVPVHRARIVILAEVLRTAAADDWTDGDLADLLVASAVDWRQPPSPLAGLYVFDVASEARRTDTNRIALARWIAAQLPRARKAARSASPRL